MQRNKTCASMSPEKPKKKKGSLQVDVSYTENLIILTVSMEKVYIVQLFVY